MVSLKKLMPFAAAALLLPLPAYADINGADTSWLLISAALVLLKMPFVAERNKLALLLKIIVVVCMGFWICIYWLQGLEGINK